MNKVIQCAVWLLCLWRHVLHGDSGDSVILGTSISSASCCDDELAAISRGAILHVMSWHANAGHFFASSHCGTGHHATCTHAGPLCIQRRLWFHESRGAVRVSVTQCALLLCSLGGAGRLSVRYNIIDFFFSSPSFDPSHFSLVCRKQSDQIDRYGAKSVVQS